MHAMPPAVTSSGPRSPARGRAGCERRTEHGVGALGQVEEREPAVGHLGRERDVLLAQRRDVDGDVRALRMGDDLERLAEPGALLGRERHLVGGTRVRERRLAAHTTAADVDDFARRRDRSVVGDAVEPLDDLRTRCAEAEDEAPVGELVEAGRGHGEQRGRARVDREDAGGELDGLGLRREVAEQADRVEPVRLRDPDQVETRRLEVVDLAHRLLDVSCVRQRRRKLHEIEHTVSPLAMRSQEDRSRGGLTGMPTGAARRARRGRRPGRRGS